MRIEMTGIEKIIEFSGGDLRQIINLLQLWQTTNREVKTGDVASKTKGIQKD